MAIADGSQCECTTLFMFFELIWSLLPWSTSFTIIETVKPIPRYYLKQTESSFVLLHSPDLKVVLKLQHFLKLKLKHFCVTSMSLLSFRITLPHPVPLFSCVKVTVLLRKCQTGALSPLSGHHGCQVTVVSNKPFTVSAASSSHARTTSLSTERAASPNVSDVCCIYFVFSPSPATIAAVGAQCKSIYHRGDKRSICSGYKSTNYSSSWEIYTNLY